MTVRLPIFPLPNVVLFPTTRLPLHVFEPRYREMTADALRGEGRIGMVLLRPGSDATQRRADVFSIGCAGRIVEHSELPDGRHLIVLEGAERFEIDDEPPSDLSYRVVRARMFDDPDFDSLDPDLQETLRELRTDLEQRMLDLVRARAPQSADALATRMSSLDPVELLHALSFGLDVPPVEKQGLLEAPDAIARARLLVGLLEFRRAETRLSSTPRNVN